MAVNASSDATTATAHCLCCNSPVSQACVRCGRLYCAKHCYRYSWWRFTWGLGAGNGPLCDDCYALVNRVGRYSLVCLILGSGLVLFTMFFPYLLEEILRWLSG
jgi:hypothetical protein